ncbi:MAG: hypothetical protein IPH54_00420 [Rhodoferax sp.]|nr:hypothetical protein [Rhodoferax sp.]
MKNKFYETIVTRDNCMSAVCNAVTKCKYSMKYPVQIKSLLVASVLLTSFSGYALTLGGARGAVLIGKPLDVSVPIRFLPEEDEASFCFDADVLYGDVRQDQSKVRVAMVASSAPNSASVRILSSTAIDEPMVTVILRAGCSQKTSRRYVLLSDLPRELAMPANAPIVSMLKPVAASGKSKVVSNGTKRASGKASSGSNAGTFQGDYGSGREVTPAATSSMKHAVAKSARKSHLKITSLDSLTEYDPVLKYSQELLTKPSENAQRRAESAALWRALNMQPEDVLREVGRVQGLDNDMQVLRALTVKNQGSLLELKNRLQKAESERFANGLVYSLIAMLLACFVGMAYLWKRGRKEPAQDQDWWHGARVSHGEPVLTNSGKQPEPEVTPEVPRPVITDIDIDLDQDPQEFDIPDPVSASRPNHRTEEFSVSEPPRVDFSHSMSGTLLSVSTQEVVDVRQQAEFFVALGEYENAIELLTRCVQAEGESSPLVYLDLFKLFHMLKRKAEYQKLREQFSESFSTQVPEFDEFGKEGHGLEFYADAMARITQAWPSAKVVDIIEDYLLASPYADPNHTFDLCAFRDLLTLHTLAKNLAKSAVGS